MKDEDKLSLGWQVWLTPRQTKIIANALSLYKPSDINKEHYVKLLEWFKHEAEVNQNKCLNSDNT